MNTLNSIFTRNPIYKLPNEGGEYSVSGTSSPSAPNFLSLLNRTPVTPQNFKPVIPKTMNSSAPQSPTSVEENKPTKPSRYINPKTGTYFTSPEEYANYVAQKLPVSKGTGDVSQYAGDAMATPNQSVENLTNTARNLSMARNDIAVGETDPYKVGKDSGIAFSPAQLNAIEKAYAGIYDPAIKDVFSRIKAKEELDTEMAKAKTEEAKLKVQKEMEIFKTNESIRQWKATTGTTKAGGASDFTRSQLNSGASKAGIGISLFEDLDPDIQNFYINTPKEMDPETEKLYPMDETFKNLIRLVEVGEKDRDEAAEEIMASNLPDVVKHHFISKLPLENKVKEGYFARIWKAITGN